MSFSILDLQRSGMSRPASPAAPAPAAAPIPEEAPAAPVAAESTPEEFEFVLGRRQVASLMFVVTVLLMLCVAGAYLAGKATSAKAPVVAGTPLVVVAHAPEPAPVVLKNEPAPVVKQAPLVEAPLYAEPKIGAVYIQMGAVEKGIAEIFAEGLRRRGLPGIVAPGPTPNIYRVLIGPLPDPASFVKAKEMVDKIGLSTFARKYPN